MTKSGYLNSSVLVFSSSFQILVYNSQKKRPTQMQHLYIRCKGLWTVNEKQKMWQHGRAAPATAGGNTTPMSYKHSSALTDTMAEGLPCPPCSLPGHPMGFPAVPRTCHRGRGGQQGQRGAGRGGGTHRGHGARLGRGWALRLALFTAVSR